MESSENFDYSDCMQNRELSWLKFNERVLEEADFTETPLMDRLKFISIFTSNLDEFFMVRVGSLTDCKLMTPEYTDNKTGMTVSEQLTEIFKRVNVLYSLRDRAFITVMNALKAYGVEYVKIDDLDSVAKKALERYFISNILPLLSPQIIDNRHPFPHIGNEQITIAVMLEGKHKQRFGLIPVPGNLDRLVFLKKSEHKFVLIEDLIYYFAELAFNVKNIIEKTVIAVTRNADIDTEERADEDIDYLQRMIKIVKKRQRLAPVRLELQYPINEHFKDYLIYKLGITKEQVFISESPLDLSFYRRLEDTTDPAARKLLVRNQHVPASQPELEKRTNMIKQVQRGDILLSLPFQSISPLLTLLKQAAVDPMVVSIKITLYRIARRSKLAETLIEAVENGKEVLVLMELRARFDENNNIEWSQRLEEAGCRVIYGMAGYKVHSKICLITRRVFGKIQHITQIGTGNYNEKTAKEYTDLCLITADPEIGLDGVDFFKNMLLNNLKGTYRKLLVAPISLKNNIIACIEEEKQKSESGSEGRIIIKCNSLTDKDIIIKLIEASQSGVIISMIVRGICCLRPGVPGMTDNISVISIVGRFLEHSRIYSFGTGESAKIYISSADLMTRNTEHRVEIACPIYDGAIRARIQEMLDIILRDNKKAHDLFADGRYILRRPLDGIAINSQELFIKKAEEESLFREESQKNGLLGYMRRLSKGVKRRFSNWVMNGRK